MFWGATKGAGLSCDFKLAFSHAHFCNTSGGRWRRFLNLHGWRIDPFQF
jgi:hypothetical protein